ncbi:FlgD immunoglobulin-like domain containing protein [Deinococcus hopiensis]|uniref:FlgD Ig-like domain-containing protein n=1 Tax=Deinococcus hopiensis KR-140 TaxID=695939 RepID=A0A1W1VFG0_9DEIO|nr:FlgD immunoglobulin-like domain containing protein [Deinococcus hopiensis]SMB91724.1 FlgD Ig-like domain-containing protein [Deinococcus hopiensis KR-140]
MTPRLLLTLALTGGLFASAIDVRDIPALPPGVSVPTPRPSTPGPAPAPTPKPPATTPTTATPPSVKPSPSTLPVGPTLGQAHRATLRGPTTLRAGGEAATWTLQLTNTGQTDIKLQHGACDLKFEVLDASGKIVRPAVTNTICTQQIVETQAGPGETTDVLGVRWDGKDENGNVLPAGTYTLRAAFWDRKVSIRPAAVTVRLTQ